VNKQSDDMALAKAAASGNRGAFEELLALHYQTIYKIAFQWCGNQADAQDITQNACIKLARAINSFRGDAKFTSWLYQLVINTAKDWQRQQSAISRKHIYDTQADIAIKPDIDEPIYAQQVMLKVYHLPEREKEALLLVASGGLSHLEAAMLIGCQESTISWRIHEARKKLNTLFGGGKK